MDFDKLHKKTSEMRLMIKEDREVLAHEEHVYEENLKALSGPVQNFV